MTTKHAIEVLLRPPVEQWSALTALSVAAPAAFMMTPGVAYASAAVFGLLAAYRFHQVRGIRRYQRNLRRLPTYSLTADRIPFSASKLFLGRGFRWEAIHTQRLHDAIVHADDYLDQAPRCGAHRGSPTQNMQSRIQDRGVFLGCRACLEG